MFNKTGGLATKDALPSLELPNWTSEQDAHTLLLVTSPTRASQTHLEQMGNDGEGGRQNPPQVMMVLLGHPARDPTPPPITKLGPGLRPRYYFSTPL
ncbi:hypothetical protein SNOG_13277 [Parastagonospora nodorum SN15]|uniref:Uncharacterized protein n=1 Tax=Phaeosphaeria nodorum (strain SN15 / ATCC MYA-4574 / FGSC 10173) TaxID=321614 RepID=Q0U4N7_PHANO|nr:hypothetical protein SNOG_13277 [Parastagonospora nodorum SN15]EAT79161.1 hypothetical protein SNOG_13277 [Parastagonospora nodorum SN15]